MPINVKSLSFKSANGVDIVCGAVYYSDNAPVKAIVLVNHGMCEHIGRYHEFMLFLARHGYAAFGHDHLGHGKTAPNAERLGYFASERGHICLVRDAHQMCQIAKNMFPGLPVFLLGHSMGSLVARLYCVKFPDSIQGAMFLGTPGPNPMTGLGLLMAQKVKRREGEFYRSERLNEMTLGKMNKRFSPTRTTHDWLTRNEQAVDKYLADPLCGFCFTASGFYDLYAMMEIASSSKWVRDYPKELPTLILSGDCDPVGGFGRGVLQIYNRLLSAGVQDLTFQLYEGDRHELLQELDRQEVYEDILSWLDMHASSPTPPQEP